MIVILLFILICGTNFETVSVCLWCHPLKPYQLKLVLNAEKSKVMFFCNGIQLPADLPRLSSARGGGRYRIGQHIQIPRHSDWWQLVFFVSHKSSFEVKSSTWLLFFFLEIISFTPGKDTFDICNSFFNLHWITKIFCLSAPDHLVKKLDTIVHCVLLLVAAVTCTTVPIHP